MVTLIGARNIAKIIDDFSSSLKDKLVASETIPVFDSATHVIRDLASQVESLKADAERYRWLRDEAHPDNEKTGLSVQDQDWNSWGKPFNRFYSGKELDALIDEARKQS